MHTRLETTMADTPLSLAVLLDQATRIYGETSVSTWTGSQLRTESFAALGRRAAQLAHGLARLGITPGDRVGTLMWNNNEHMTAYMALPAMGAVLHTLNLRLTPKELVYIANHGGDAALLVDASLLPLFNAMLPDLRTIQHVVVANGDPSGIGEREGIQVHRYDDVVAGQPETYEWPVLDEQAAAAMCYTSGTTGAPKGVVYSHRSIYLHSMGSCMPTAFGMRPGDSVLAIVPMFHALCWGVPHAAMMVGAELILPERFMQPEGLTAIMAASRPTLSVGVPTIWQGIYAYLREHPQDISHLRGVVVGGAPTPPALMKAFDEELGVRIICAWGLTETSPLASLALERTGASPEETWEERLSAGRLQVGVQARVTAEDGTALPWDGTSVGEIEVRGPWVTASYHGDQGPEATPDKFRDGWLRTGDMGTISPHGYIRLTDRAKDVIKSGGEWISSVELENDVMSHPAVREAAVIGIPDELWTERPLVCTVLRDGMAAEPEDLRQHLVGKVARWQLPENWTFIAEVPKTGTGKFDKKKLRALFAEGSLEVVRLGRAPEETPVSA